jgi:UDP-2-acetamido-3-amino-2,3-dideoxy-glucuronate N-acetyltransferase
MAGVPARRVGWVSHAGEVLGQDLVCPRTGDRYAERPDGLRRMINLSGFGEDSPENLSEEQSASVG